MRFLENSIKPIPLEIPSEDKVILFQQYFLHNNKERSDEIKYCLEKNVSNKNIDTIYLLNERIYTDEELGVSSAKIIQINIGHRLLYSDIIDFVEKQVFTKSYVIITNADIFIDDSLANLKTIDLVSVPCMFAQLRYEFDGPSNVKIFGPRPDSQDVWVYHTSLNKRLFNHIKAFKFMLGMAGCDNHITYLFKILNFKIINDPMLIHCLHFHKTQIREYKQEDRIKIPYMLVNPYYGVVSTEAVSPRFDDNNKLYTFLSTKLNEGVNFIIPRVAGVENNIAYTCSMNKIDVMKNNAGIKLTDKVSIAKYSKMYFQAFKNCKMYFIWEKDGEVYKGISASQDYIEQTLCSKNTQKCWAFALDIFHYIYSEPWTLALKGKRVLIVSAFTDSIEKKISIREKIYGIDLFPDCTFEFIKPPQTQGTNPSEEWDIEMESFCERLDELKDYYDVALVSAGGYGNLICNYIYEQHNKSAIYVGGVLQMYFGLLGNRWLEERGSIVRMFINEHWSRPMETERPAGHQAVEKSCYW